MDPQARGLAAKALKLVRPSLRGRQLRIIPFGDSITQNAAGFSANVWQYDSGYAEASIYSAGRRFQIVRNAGIAGNTTTQMLARLQTDVLAYSPDVVLLLGGTNDFTSGIADGNFTTCFNNLESIVVQCLASGALPVIVTCPPKDLAAAESRKAQVLYYLLAKAYGLPLIDLYRILVDPLTGTYQTGMSLDGVHPSPAGIASIMAVAGPILANLDAAHSGPYLAAYSETATGNFANLLRNGNFARVTSTPTPDGWTISQTNATATVPAAVAPYTGNTYTYNKTATGLVNALSANNVSAGFSVGDTLIYSGRVKASGMTPATATGFLAELQMWTTGFGTKVGNFRPVSNWVQNGDFVFSAEMTVPATIAILTAAVAVLDVSQIEINSLTLWNKTAALAIWSPRYA